MFRANSLADKNSSKVALSIGNQLFRSKVPAKAENFSETLSCPANLFFSPAMFIHLLKNLSTPSSHKSFQRNEIFQLTRVRCKLTDFVAQPRPDFILSPFRKQTCVRNINSHLLSYFLKIAASLLFINVAPSPPLGPRSKASGVKGGKIYWGK